MILRSSFYSICLFLLNLLSFSANSQEVNTDTLNGIAYYVYPFAQELNVHSSLYQVVKYPKGKRMSFKEWYILEYGEDYDKKEFRRVRREAIFRPLTLSSIKYRRRFRHLKRSSVKHALWKNPFPLMEPKYTLDSDIIPSLDPIPDGKYVQYFSNYFDIGKHGIMEYSEDRVAAFFSIKNNMLEGDAVWFNAAGDSLKYGRFEKGQKTGMWYLENRKLNYSLTKNDAESWVKIGGPEYCDTLIEYTNYKNGFKEGYYSGFYNSVNPIEEGYYSQGVASGKWIMREIKFTGVGKNRKRLRLNDVVTWTYSPIEQGEAVTQTVIRRKLYRSESYMGSPFDFSPKYSVSFSPSKIYELNYPEEPDLELEEEKLTSYDGEEYEEEYYEGEEYEEYFDEGGDYSAEADPFEEFKNLVYDEEKGVSIPVAKLIDSLGIRFKYDGIYEKRYPNGQLMVRYEFKDGKLVKEDTIFWDNGNPYDVILFNSDSSQYLQTIYDYNGKRYQEIVYDQKGNFVRVNFRPERIKSFMISDLKVTDDPDDRFFFYDHLDTLSSELKDSLLIFRSWFKEDTSLLYSRYYNPVDRMLRYETYSITGKNTLRAELEFSENFESWNGKKWYTLGELTLQSTASAALYEYYEKDSIPQQMMNQYDEIYDINQDQVLFLKEKPFSGELTLTASAKKLKIAGSKHLHISLPRMKYDEKKHKDLERYREKGKLSNKFLFGVIDASELDEEFSETIFGNLLGGFIPTIEYPYSYDGYDEFGGEIAIRESKRSPFVKTIQGSFLEGKPQGDWKVYDQFGKLLYSMNFEKGVLNGPYKEFDTKEPEERYNDPYEEELSSLLKDSFPKRKTHYLYSSTDYKNGFENGKYTRFNWYGGIEEEVNYLDGFAQGPAFERNKLAYTSLNYKDGELDGYVKTYLTLNGTDSTLLYDLNFQNGLLQGESKAYHLSGRLAKSGFFLNGDPIDDYEAFDTLGFRYHYVKFQFGFPVEEKIWEENELSVRYMFDWRDSIYFQPSDITSTQSLDRVLANLGIGSDYYQRPYFGRPSLVNKQGIDYHITKYYPNDTIARDGQVSSGKKVSCWKYYSYEGEFLYEADYFDTIIKVNDSIQFKAKGILTDYDRLGRKLSESYIIEKFEKYDCSHTDHYEIRQLMTIWQGKDSVDRMNGYVKNYYDNGVLQNEGNMKDGLPTGIWKFYDPFGKLNQVGTYVMGKRDGRWLGGDLSKTKYLGDICLNPNLPHLEEELKYREKQLDIVITNYHLGKALNKEFYDVDLNEYEEEEDDSTEE